MPIGKWFIGGLVGAVVGIGLWTGVVWLTGYESGLIASFIGIFVGVGVAGAAGVKRGQAAALFAAAMAFLAVLGGKASCAWVYSQRYLSDMIASPEQMTDEYAISCLADDVVSEYEWNGEDLDYPPGADTENPDSAGDYPRDVWAEAVSQWDAMTPAQQMAYRDSVAPEGTAASAFLFALITGFGLFDFVWLGLAVSSAYKIVRTVPAQARAAAGTVTVEEEPAGVGFFPMIPSVQDGRPEEPGEQRRAG